MKATDLTMDVLMDNLSPTTAAALSQYVNLVRDVVGIDVDARKIIREATLIHIAHDTKRTLDEMPMGKAIIIADQSAGFGILTVDEALRTNMQRLINKCHDAL